MKFVCDEISEILRVKVATEVLRTDELFHYQPLKFKKSHYV